MNSFLKH